MRRRWLSAVPLVSVSLFAGCASATVVPGTGDISFRLSWSGPADLDLHVEDPAGDELSFVKRRSESGGLLDIDCNASPEEVCRRPIENVYWPPGRAPEGLYRYRVEFFQSLEKVGEVDFVLEVRLGETVVERRTGQLSTEYRLAGPFEFVFQATSDPRPEAARVGPPTSFLWRWSVQRVDYALRRTAGVGKGRAGD